MSKAKTQKLFVSVISDSERLELARRVARGKATDEDAERLISERSRINQKIGHALVRLSEGLALDDHSLDSAELLRGADSAMASTGVLGPAYDYLLNEGPKAARMLNPLGEGRRMSAVKRAQAARKRKEDLVCMAADYWRKKPGAKIDEVVSYLRSYEQFSRLTDNGIARKIKGVKTHTLKAMGTK